MFLIGGKPDEANLKKLAQTDQRRLVEAMGVEPMSALQQAPSATCLFFDYTMLPPRRQSIQQSRLRDTYQATLQKTLTWRSHLVLYESIELTGTFYR